MKLIYKYVKLGLNFLTQRERKLDASLLKTVQLFPTDTMVLQKILTTLVNLFLKINPLSLNLKFYMLKVMQSQNWLSQHNPARAQLCILRSTPAECAKLIIQSEISRVVYKDFYKNDEGIKLIKKANIEINKYEYK